MKEVPINNSQLINAWEKIGIKTPADLYSILGIEPIQAKDIADNKILPSPEVIGLTLELFGLPYEEGSYTFLDPWMHSIREAERRRKISATLQGGTHSDETRRKMSEAHQGRTPEAEAERRHKMSKAHKGKTLSDETKRKISVAKQGKTHSDETRRKMSEAHQGRTHSNETRRKISMAQLRRSPEVEAERRRKISEAQKQRRVNERVLKEGDELFL